MRQWFERPVRVAVVLCQIVSCMLIVGCKPEQEAEKKEVVPVQIGPEDFALVSQQQLESGPLISGTLAAAKQATVRAQLSGSVLRTTAQQGDRVGGGALLAVIDATALGDASASAQTAVATAKSALEIAIRDEKRLESLVEIGAIPARDLDNARRATAAARAQVAAAQAQLAAARKQVGLTQVRSPFAGTVSEKLVNTGDVVQPGSPLYTIVAPSSMELSATIPAEQLSAVRVGAPVVFTVTGYTDRIFNGTITRINPNADAATRQVRVYAEIPANAGLVGGLYAEGRVASQSRSALTVPTSAIDKRMTKPAVTRVRNGRTERVEVTLGITDERTERIELASGVRNGDTVLVGTARQMTPGTLVRAKGAGAPAQQAAGRAQ